MATAAQSSVDRSPLPSDEKQSFATVIDRWIYVFMAVLFIATTLVGFIPDSLQKIAAVRAGQAAPFPVILHVHAVLMGSWLLLLLAQTVLMATGRPALHKQLGMAAVVLAPAMVIAWIVLVPTMLSIHWRELAAPPPGMTADAVATTRMFLTSLFAGQVRAVIVFAILIAWAFRARRTDTGLHKRLIFLATVMPLPAAIDRIAWLPTSYPFSMLSPDLYTLLWISPLFLWDVYRLKRIHRAYVIWFLVCLPLTIGVHMLWGNPWWVATVPKLMGLA
jgi:hypothetical protein